MSERHLHVPCAIIEKDGCDLAARRRPGLPGLGRSRPAGFGNLFTVCRTGDTMTFRPSPGMRNLYHRCSSRRCWKSRTRNAAGFCAIGLSHQPVPAALWIPVQHSPGLAHRPEPGGSPGPGIHHPGVCPGEEKT